MKDLLIAVGVFAFLYLLFQRGGKTVNDVIARMAEAMKTFEGWWPGSRSYRNQNPGNIRQPVNLPNWFPPGAIAVDDQRHFIFDTYDNGWNALLHQLALAFTGRSRTYFPGMTISEFFQHYAEGSQEQYSRYVAAQLGVTPDTRLQDLVQT